MPAIAQERVSALTTSIAEAVRTGLSATPKTLPPWLFYDEAGSRLFEQITELPEYYLTRTERAILATHADAILTGASNGRPVSVVELGAGTATKTGILLRCATHRQTEVLYQPIDVSPSALEEAKALERAIPGVCVRPQVANYITDAIHIERDPGTRVLALYIGSSVGNFSPSEARGLLGNLHSQLRPGDSLLLGTDLAPGPYKSVETLLAAYDDAEGVTAAFNRNVLTRLNSDLGSDFRPECFAHRARWNAVDSRMEMHLEALSTQNVRIPGIGGLPALRVAFVQGETIHTENSYKFTPESIANLLTESNFVPVETWRDPANLFAVTLAAAG